MSRSFFRTYGFLGAMLLSIVLGCVLARCGRGGLSRAARHHLHQPHVLHRRAARFLLTCRLHRLYEKSQARGKDHGHNASRLCRHRADRLGHHGHSHASLSPGAQAVDGRSGGRC